MKQSMKNSYLSSCIPVIALLLFAGVTIQALDMEGAKERPCFEIKKTVKLDPNWISSSNLLYYPVMSRLELYNSALDIANRDADSLQENEVYYESCLKFEQKNDEFAILGFGKRATYTFSPCNSTGEVESCHFTGASGKGATAYVTLTDNSTFFFTAVCNDDNQMTWGVSSTLKTLPKETITVIHEHAESLGFSKKYFTGLLYDTCAE